MIPLRRRTLFFFVGVLQAVMCGMQKQIYCAGVVVCGCLGCLGNIFFAATIGAKSVTFWDGTYSVSGHLEVVVSTDPAATLAGGLGKPAGAMTAAYAEAAVAMAGRWAELASALATALA